MQGVQDFAIEGQNTYIQSRNKILMMIRLADENGEEILGLEGLVEAIEDFELKTGLLIAACMILMNDGSSLIKSLKSNKRTSDRGKNTKIGSYLQNKQILVVSGVLTNQKKDKNIGNVLNGKTRKFGRL